MENTKLNFGQALEAAKQGKLIAREGWNGKGMFVFQRPADELQSLFIIESLKSMPQSVKDWLAVNNTIEGRKLDVIKFTSYLCMKAADGSITNGWNASQPDMLAEDWQVL